MWERLKAWIRPDYRLPPPLKRPTQVGFNPCPTYQKPEPTPPQVAGWKSAYPPGVGDEIEAHLKGIRDTSEALKRLGS